MPSPPLPARSLRTRRAAIGVLLALACPVAACSDLLGIGDIIGAADGGSGDSGADVEIDSPALDSSDLDQTVPSDGGSDSSTPPPGEAAPECVHDNDCPSGIKCCANVCVDVTMDRNNCAGCGVVCASCFSSRCVALIDAPGLGAATGIALGAGTIYVTTCGSDGGAALKSVPVDGGAPATLQTLPSGSGCPSNLVIDSDTAYFSANFSIMAVPLAGGSLATLAPASTLVGGIALGGGRVFWTDTALRSTGLDGGPVVTLEPLGGAGGVVTAPAGLYYADRANMPDAGSVNLTTLAGGPVTTIAANVSFPMSVVSTANGVYWATNRAGGPIPDYVAYVAADGGMSYPLTNVYQPTMVTDGNEVFVADGYYLFTLANGSTAWWVPVWPGTSDYGMWLAVDDAGVYAAVNQLPDLGALYRVTPK